MHLVAFTLLATRRASNMQGLCPDTASALGLDMAAGGREPACSNRRASHVDIQRHPYSIIGPTSPIARALLDLFWQLALIGAQAPEMHSPANGKQHSNPSLIVSTLLGHRLAYSVACVG